MRQLLENEQEITFFAPTRMVKKMTEKILKNISRLEKKSATGREIKRTIKE